MLFDRPFISESADQTARINLTLFVKLKTSYPNLATTGTNRAISGRAKDSNKIVSGAKDFLYECDHVETIARIIRSMKRGTVRHKENFNTALLCVDSKAVVILEFSGAWSLPTKSGNINGIKQTMMLIHETNENEMLILFWRRNTRFHSILATWKRSDRSCFQIISDYSTSTNCYEQVRESNKKSSNFICKTIFVFSCKKYITSDTLQSGYLSFNENLSNSTHLTLCSMLQCRFILKLLVIFNMIFFPYTLLSPTVHSQSF